mgnify:CR=1 FL=1
MAASYSALRRAVAPHVCPFYKDGRCVLGIKRASGCLNTVPYSVAINALKALGFSESEAVKELENYRRWGFIDICTPVERRDGASIAKGAALGALLGILGGPTAALLFSIVGGITGWATGVADKVYEKRVIFLKESNQTLVFY